MRVRDYLFIENENLLVTIVPLITLLFLVVLFCLGLIPLVSIPGLSLSESVTFRNLVANRNIVEIIVEKDGSLRYKNEPISQKQLENFFNGLNSPKTSVILKVNQQTPIMTVVKIRNLAGKYNITDFHLVLDTKGQ
ncbi:MAG: biopolymer transporter ExbD [Candidatus Omnitrophica bacterium]|nr:biopolymer transporter ExbD [Candidatus Omnitrophota bacterium]